MYIIKNGLIVTPSIIYKADVFVENDKITQIGNDLKNNDAVTINAEGKYLFPGGIDVHTHMEFPFGGTVSCDDFKNGTKAAAFGGITTIIDFAVQQKSQSLKETVKARRLLADNNVYIDYSLHLGITDLTDSVMDEISEIINQGYPSFKLFMTYDFAVDDYTLFNALKKANEYGGIISVHAENQNMIIKNTEKLLQSGCIEPKYHAKSRPDYVEAEAISRACLWAEETGSKLYIMHLSTAKGMKIIQESRKRGGKIYCETCPQYLLLTKDKYDEDNFAGAKYVMSPPLRDKIDNEILWSGLADGDIEIVSSDHCPFTLDDKKMGIDRFDKIPNGVPGVETLMMLLYSEGVLKNKITINKMTELLSSNPAKIFGLKDKGSIEIGKDADLVVFDPNATKKLSYDTLHTKNDYSTFEGLEVTGVPVLTMSRGKIICNDKEFFAKKSRGLFIERKLEY